MKKKLEGIIIRTIKYRETSVITDAYTSEVGLQSYIVNNVRSSKSRMNIALFQPLTLVRIVGYYNENRNLQRLNEITCQHPYMSINRNIKKTAIAIYLAEFLNNILKHEEPNKGLFEYVRDSLIHFDEIESGYENFHLNFIINCARHLGFAPENADYLFSSVPGNYSPENRLELNQLMEVSYPQDVILDNSTRAELLDLIITYYRLHIEGFKQLNSSGILHDVLN